MADESRPSTDSLGNGKEVAEDTPAPALSTKPVAPGSTEDSQGNLLRVLVATAESQRCGGHSHGGKPTIAIADGDIVSSARG